MKIELKVPAIGESITEVEIGAWLKAEGEHIEKDQPVAALESEKATVELTAPQSGRLVQLLKKKGDVAKVGEVIGYVETAAATGATGTTPTAPPVAEKELGKEPLEPAPRTAEATQLQVMPAAKVALARHGLRPEQVEGTGPGGRILKEDVLRQAAQAETGKAPAPASEIEASVPAVPPRVSSFAAGREEEIVPMSRLRRTVAERLVEAQRTAALLTTFNEVDMSEVISLRQQQGEAFKQKYQAKLGFMSFFVKAAVDALKQFPVLNAQVRGTSIVYHNFYDIGVAVGGGKGLVVPVLRNAERMSFAEIEVAIASFALRARENKLKVEELQDGTFTISNGGVYGSLLSTPLINPPQSGVLGLHAIQERPVVRQGAVVARPMMYVALTYDHRLVDGREAVSFLRRVKEVIESPARMLMEI